MNRRSTATLGPRRDRSNCGVGVLMDLDGTKSHAMIEEALGVLDNLDHRGARGAEENTGDGAGILIQKPHAFFTDVVSGLGDADTYGVGQLFLPPDEHTQKALRSFIEEQVRAEGFEVIAWRDVPTDASDLGPTAQATEPDVWQLFVQPEEPMTPETLDANLYILRRLIENSVAACDLENSEIFYVCSLDRRKIVYKGLLTNAQVRSYYPDLSAERVESTIALVHSRFSTNTLGAWRLAHPYRTIVHNGEVNTLRGNFNWMQARESDLASELLGDEFDRIRPVTTEAQSDTAVLDNVLELLAETGRSLPHALRMLIPEAWNKNERLDPDRRAWYDYHSTLIEPWDGPLLVAFTDGDSVGAALDRNGLRPCRYWVTHDNRLVMASEAGVVDLPPGKVSHKNRLQPGQLFLADAEEGRIVPEDEVFDRLTDEKYAQWLDEQRVRLRTLVSADPSPDETVPEADLHLNGDPHALPRLQKAFSYSREHVRRLMQPMVEDGKDPVGAMGNDTPPAVLSDHNKALFTYFKQLFAQVSNPPLDYIREELVTSLESHIGSKGNLLNEEPEDCRQLHLESPILGNAEFRAIQNIDANGIRSTTVDTTFDPETSLEEAVERVRRDARQAIDNGYEVLILSDRAAGADRLPIPSLLIVGAVHHNLIRTGRRTKAGLVLDSGQPCAVHHFCTLIGYGADAIHPYLAYTTVRDLVDRADGVADAETALERYTDSIEKGLLKVMAKMGISTLESYKGAQVFEAVGLTSDFVENYFSGTTSRIEGVGIAELEEDVRERHENAFNVHIPGSTDLETGGELYWRRDGEHHQWNPQTIGKLQHAVRANDRAVYDDFAQHINDQSRQHQTLRGLLDFDADTDDAIPLDEVEPVENIVQRFFTSSMSFGSLSPEAHETLAIAMNRLGGMASTGEGGEQVDRFGTERECSIKQVASGRFGVTSTYLKNADHIEIKMAQGSKPGEGGHLPGQKVNDIIAKTRYTTPGVSLISPPPHHDIYSIEDLAQLIHDLKSANPDADVHVKLVSAAGIGVIAAGVAKAKADAVLISGESGGTGASPKTSIKSAGLPWELGVTEAQQILLENELRSRIRMRVDGGLKTGRDIAMAALMGAEEYGFGTGALVTLGCIMLRKCHCNTCSVGIATQDPELRKKFVGEPEHVINYMRFVAEELREIMATLGFRTVDEMVGRTDKLRQRETDHRKARRLDLSPLLRTPESDDDLHKTQEQDHGIDEKIDHTLIEEAQPALEDETPVHLEHEIHNRDRTVGATLSGEVTGRYGPDGLPDDTIRIDFDGVAGQSFGAFLANGITLDLDGEANDYVGKGLSGGRIIIRTPDDAGWVADENIILGNVALYGATRGEAYFNGQGGERFAVRNSGVQAVVEGVGDHGCEYMTGGVVVILGDTGRNFGAGMSGGEAYVLDESGNFESKVNPGMVHVERLTEERDQQLVRRLVETHLHHTDSEKAQRVLDNWDTAVDQFRKVMPNAFAKQVEEHLKKGKDIRPPVPPAPSEHTPVAA
ncbi:glutamate synthase subunit alpha [Salinibacter sp. 10B]|uniref:glutamate synthase large subunit n=1 Tax=Salinibacter sp. 10B TaxID=1923971 RepID=UPI000D2D4022|nr:glutamate synthase large subunit [Salinibacter sp. 10B]PQJ35252.1 glutamate synthase subunit alpha [Salinibacter sp. 10B]